MNDHRTVKHFHGVLKNHIDDCTPRTRTIDYKMSVGFANGLYSAVGDVLKETDSARDLLKQARDMLEQLRDNETCDHSVGICWCGHHRLIHQIDSALGKDVEPEPEP